jgi:hypothetical protein
MDVSSNSSSTLGPTRRGLNLVELAEVLRNGGDPRAHAGQRPPASSTADDFVIDPGTAYFQNLATEPVRGDGNCLMHSIVRLAGEQIGETDPGVVRSRMTEHLIDAFLVKNELDARGDVAGNGLLAIQEPYLLSLHECLRPYDFNEPRIQQLFHEALGDELVVRCMDLTADQKSHALSMALGRSVDLGGGRIASSFDSEVGDVMPSIATCAFPGLRLGVVTPSTTPDNEAVFGHGDGPVHRLKLQFQHFDPVVPTDTRPSRDSISRTAPFPSASSSQRDSIAGMASILADEAKGLPAGGIREMLDLLCETAQQGSIGPMTGFVSWLHNLPAQERAEMMRYPTAEFLVGEYVEQSTAFQETASSIAEHLHDSIKAGINSKRSYDALVYQHARPNNAGLIDPDSIARDVAKQHRQQLLRYGREAAADLWSAVPNLRQMGPRLKSRMADAIYARLRIQVEESLATRVSQDWVRFRAFKNWYRDLGPNWRSLVQRNSAGDPSKLVYQALRDPRFARAVGIDLHGPRGLNDLQEWLSNNPQFLAEVQGAVQTAGGAVLADD